MRFLVVGDRNNYRIDSISLYDAWLCAKRELKYGITGNREVITIKTLN